MNRMHFTGAILKFTLRILKFTVFGFSPLPFGRNFTSSNNPKNNITMKTLIATLVLFSLVLSSNVRANTDSIAANAPASESFSARISLLNGDTIRFLILNPDGEDVVVKVYSDHNLKVMEYDLNGEKALKLNYSMKDMRKCCYTAVVERNEKKVASKKITLE